MKKLSFLGVLFCLSLLGAAVTSYAGDKLSGDQVRQLLSGNSVQGEHLKKGFAFKHYYTSDGTVTAMRSKGNKKNKRIWTVSDEGEFCYKKPSGGGFCGTFYSDGEKYKVLKNDDVHLWSIKVINGNEFGF